MPIGEDRVLTCIPFSRLKKWEIIDIVEGLAVIEGRGHG